MDEMKNTFEVPACPECGEAHLLYLWTADANEREQEVHALNSVEFLNWLGGLCLINFN